MKFFIDTANVEDIKKANDMGVICGVTTNPSLIAKEGRDFGEVIREIASIVDGPISGEVKATTEDAAGMIAEGREIAAIHPNMVVKIPMTVEGLKATKVLSAEGIKCNVTLIFSANQALLAARAGAAYALNWKTVPCPDCKSARCRKRGDPLQESPSQSSTKQEKLLALTKPIPLDLSRCRIWSPVGIPVMNLKQYLGSFWI